MPVDNSAVIRRQQQRMNGLGGFRGGPVGAMGDYPSDLPNRILVTKGIAPSGPITAPTIMPPPSNAPEAMIMELRDMMSRLPQAMSDEWRTRFVVTPREAVSFIAPGGFTSVAAGAAVAVASQQVTELFTGFVTHIGIAAAPSTALIDIVWQLRLNGAIHPQFFNRQFAANSLSTPIPFVLEVTQNRLIELVAINNAAVPIDVAGVLVGWMEFLTTNKRYGSSPTTGIG